MSEIPYENVHLVRRMISGKYALVNTKSGQQGANDMTDEVILTFADYMHQQHLKYQGAHHGDTKQFMFYTEDPVVADQIADVLGISPIPQPKAIKGQNYE